MGFITSLLKMVHWSNPQIHYAKQQTRKGEPRRNDSFPGSAAYWEGRYKSGRDSGAGSYNRLAQFKAHFINKFVDEKSIESVVEFGCGDGNQLSLANYPSYVGYDVSDTVLHKCRSIFSSDKRKAFKIYSDYNGEHFDLGLSLDVIYHLVEDDVFEKYMSDLFRASTRFVIIYSSNKNEDQKQHVRHRKFTDWIESKQSEWLLVEHVPNIYPYDENDPSNTSFADFYVFAKGGILERSAGNVALFQ